MNAALYHAHHSQYLEDISFWRAIAAQQAGPALELGCGTGRVLLDLAKAGCPILGLDRDAEMLAFLTRQAAPQAGVRVNVFQADMTAFHLASRFQLILLPCNTFSTLTPAQRQATLRRVRQHLHPQGIFVFSIPNPQTFFDLPARGAEELEEVIYHPMSGDPVLVSSAWKRSKTLFSVFWHYDVQRQDGQTKRVTVQIDHQLTRARQYAEEIKTAGLHVEAQFGDFEGSIYTPDSPDLIFIAGLPG